MIPAGITILILIGVIVLGAIWISHIQREHKSDVTGLRTDAEALADRVAALEKAGTTKG